jgi:uncharacterized phage protein (TIGR01671 family)
MKREIEFKAVDRHTGELVFGYYGIKGIGTDLEKHYIMVSTLNITPDVPVFYFTDVEIIKETLAQFTGKYDKNGVKIFEKDLIKFTRTVGNYQIGKQRLLTTEHIIVWDKEQSRFALSNGTNLQKFREHPTYIYEVVCG